MEVLNTGRAELADTFLHTISALFAEHAVESPVVHARADDAQARRALAQNRLGASLQHKLRALRGYERAGDRRMACALQVSVGYAQTQLGAHAEAERTLTFALATAEQLQLAGLAPSARENLGQALAGLGRWGEAMAMIEHLNVLRFHDAGVEGDRVWLLLELVDGPDLRTLTQRAGGALPVARAVRLVRQASEGVAAWVQKREPDFQGK